MNNPAISVVVTIYNQEKYIRKCIRSVIGQKLQNIEIILVNDGSTDKSLNICQKYARIDQRISIIDKRNEGVSQARKDGFIKAKGEYVCFLDGDDYLAPNTLDTLNHIADKHDVDMVIGNFFRVWDNWGLVKKKPIPFFAADQLIDKDRIISFMMQNDPQNGFATSTVCGRIIRRSVILKALETGSVLFPDNRKEDLFFNLAITPYLKTIWLTNKTVLYYRYGGITCRNISFLKLYGLYFDMKFSYCLNSCNKDSLPFTFQSTIHQYFFELKNELAMMLHYRITTIDNLREIIRRELMERKVVLWGRQNYSVLPFEMRQDTLIQAILNCNVDVFLGAVQEYEQFMRKHHYWKMKILECYQRIADIMG